MAEDFGCNNIAGMLFQSLLQKLVESQDATDPAPLLILKAIASIHVRRNPQSHAAFFDA